MEEAVVWLTAVETTSVSTTGGLTSVDAFVALTSIGFVVDGGGKEVIFCFFEVIFEVRV
ncbi:hypothetical protein HanIR_Chr01g0014031 [Helianthus annuus]|nr:hypothetical protein HanIR_Chr01g0014031 [Helianthus annuus]